MKLLVIAQKVDINDDNLGFFHHWLTKLAGKTEKLSVICLAEGEHHLPGNVIVYSLGKERGYSKIRQFFRLQMFLLKNLKNADGIFAHMCPIYAIASYPLAKIFRKKMILWYAHGGVNLKLKIVEKMVDEIVTSSIQGCRLKSKKIKVLGQGIDTDLFRPPASRSDDGIFKILYAGRLVPVKDHQTLIRAIGILVNERNIKKVKVNVLGTPLTDSQRKYLDNLRILAREIGVADYIDFLPGVSYFKMPAYYQWANLLVNPSSTGSLDKVVLEAMACGCLVLNCNEAYSGILADKYLFKKGDAEDLARKMIALIGEEDDPSLRGIVVESHNLSSLINKIVTEFYVRD
jgi:glycosyltransferase involved in cell wall biosynthesis